MKPTAVVTTDQIDDQISKAFDADDNGTAYPGASYEQGVANALNWAFGLGGDLGDEPPIP